MARVNPRVTGYERHRPYWGHFGALSGPSWGHFWTILGHLGGILELLEAVLLLSALSAAAARPARARLGFQIVGTGAAVQPKGGTLNQKVVRATKTCHQEVAR